ncbi:MAG: hypothetical protein LBH76_08120, partial [Propionibacteriaceae bacterium]|nr:hypothetical protein [Propionibacteriaceae bacterium]
MRISRFTPWQTPRRDLEAIFVARQPILDELVARAERAAGSASRPHTLLVGPRGAGKTHLLAMLYYRLGDAIAQGRRLQVARLPEDPVTVVSYPRLLAAVMSAVDSGQTARLDADTLEAALDRRAAEAGPIVVLLENLDEVFAQIGVDGQRKLRHYLQTSTSLLLMSTTALLDRSLTAQDSPFYGFFSVIRLQPLTVDHAQDMLTAIARVHGDTELAEWLGGDVVRRRLEIVAHLAGSQPRLWSMFADIMGPDGFTQVADLLYASFDDLTPYYRDRLMSLTAQQRLVVAELAEADHALPVQAIAARTALPERSVARTLGELKDAGWVQPATSRWAHLLDRRRTYYELAEPLARIAFQVKDTLGQPIRLIVNFLSIWFDREQITKWSGDDNMYAAETAASFGSDSSLRLVRRLARLPDSVAADAALIGQA